jgi:hypothetical protein
MDTFKLLTLKHEVLKIYVNIQTAVAVETHLAEKQWLEKLKVVKLRMFRVRTGIPTVSRTEGAIFNSIQFNSHLFAC